jgi:PKD repeat protein
VLKLTLNPGSYTWQFVPVAGQTFADAGSGTCHDAPPATNHAPTAAPGGPYTGAEGAAVSFDGGGSSDPDGDALTYAWSFGDGGTGPGATPSHTYADNGNYVVTLTVTDTHAAASTPATTTVTIGNVAPTVNTGANQSATVGSPVAVSASFSDRGVNDGPWGYSIDWGDGTTPSAGTATSQASPVTGTHTYGAAGTNTVRVTVTDKDGGAGSGTLGVTVVQPVASVTLVGAGNIARCDRTGDEATAAVLDGIAGTVFALGDAAYPGGTATSYQNCYHPSWGRHKARTYPVPGHRDYDSSATATGYFSYFGTAAGDPTKGYYSYDLGAWHIVALNSNSSFVATAAGSPQETWLRADLAATTKQCVLALWHHPRFYSTTSSSFSPTSSVKPFWDDLVAARAELIINAHLRDYERFGPQTSAGVADPVNGIRQIIVGSGGEGLDNPNTLIAANSEVRISGVYGVLQLTLYDGSYSWQFVPVAGQTATDSGSGSCR